MAASRIAKTYRLPFGVIVLGALVFPTAAAAQTDPATTTAPTAPNDQTDTSGEIADIVVTAQGCAEPLGNVPAHPAFAANPVPAFLPVPHSAAGWPR